MFFFRIFGTVSATRPMPTPTPLSISFIVLKDLSMIELVSDRLGEIDEADDRDDDVLDVDIDESTGVNDESDIVAKLHNILFCSARSFG